MKSVLFSLVAVLCGGLISACGGEPIHVDIATGSPIHILTVGQEDKLAFAFQNPNPDPVTFHFTAQLQSYDGANLPCDAGTLSVPAMGNLSWPVPGKIGELGLWYVDYRLIAPDGSSQTGKLSFAHLTPAGRRTGAPNGILFGIGGGDLGDKDAHGRDLDLMIAEAAGMDIMRTTLQFEAASPRRGVWNQDALQRFSAGLDALANHGMQAEFLLGYTPKYADPPEAAGSPDRKVWMFAPPDPDAWKDYVHQMASHFGDRIKYWEVWNEADIVQFWTGTYEQYSNILKVSHDEIKAVNPDLQVMTSGFATLLPHGGRRDPDFMAKVVKNDAANFDILAFHQHGDFGPYAKVLDGPLQKIRDTAPGKPLFFTETAYARGQGDQLPAKYVWEKLIYAWSHGAMAYEWFTLRAGDLDTTKGTFNWGIYTSDFMPTPTFVSYNTLVTYLRDKTYAGKLDLGPDDYGFLFKGANADVIASWSGPDAAQSLRTIVQAGGATKAYQVDLMGNTKEVAVQDGSVLLSTDEAPNFLVLEGVTSEPKITGPLLSVLAPALAVPGRKVQLALTVSNPFGEEKEIHFQPHFGGSDPEQTARVPAGQVSKVSAEVALPVGDGKFKKTIDGTISYAVPGTSWQGDLPVRIRSAASVPSSPMEDRPADFELATYDHVVNFNENVPQREKYTWKGPADLSAKVWLQATDDGLAIRALVNDDIVGKPFTGADLNLGDSIELGFKVPGQNNMWHLGVAMQGATAEVHCWEFPTYPHGMPDPTPFVKATATRTGTTYQYDVQFPWTALGFKRGAPAPGQVAFDFLANDNDGESRKGWIEVVPGLGQDKDPDKFIPLVLEPKPVALAPQ